MPMSPRLLRPRAAAGGFDPRRISGAFAWFDASDASTLTVNTANSPNTISQWRDKIGGRHFNQASSASQPVITTHNSLSALSFVSKQMGSSAAASEWGFLHQPNINYDVFMVCRSNSRSVFSTGWISTFNNNTNNIGVVFGHSNVSMIAQTSAGGAQTSAAADLNMDVPFSYQQIMTAFRLRGDLSNATAANRLSVSTHNGRSSGAATGTSGTPSASNPFATLQLGVGCNGVLCELLFYTRASNLTDAESSAVMTYLATKWGLS